jgi:glucose-1-phosphate thymidylyltransferase
MAFSLFGSSGGGGVVKAVVLCAGEGTRLRPLTHTSAKHLIPVANRPVILHTLEAIREAGIREIGVVVSPNVEDEFRTALKDGSQWDLEIDYVLQEQPKGLAHAVACARDYVGRQPFLVYLGDNLLENGVRQFVADFKRGQANATLMLTEVENPTSFGVARLEDGQIAQLIEKPKEPPSNLAIVGVYLFDHHIFEAIEQIRPSQRGELEITDAIQHLIEQGYRVHPHLVQGWWKDVGRPDDMLDANRLLLEDLEPQIRSPVPEDSRVIGRVSLAEGVEIQRSELRGPLIIGPGAVICDAFVGPFTALDREVKIHKSEIEYSIVMAGASIESVGRINQSIIGRGVRIHHCNRPPETYRFVLGDSSEVQLI